MPVVIKIGGSQFGDLPLLTDVCGEVSSFQGNAVVVAGGGAFADCVRDNQARLKFGEETAHGMAILGMEQNALILSEFIDRAVVVSKLEDFARAWENRKIPVWMPFAECIGDSELTPSWEVTSDAICARLAERIGAVGLIVLKSCAVDPTWSLDEMTAKGVVDPVFSGIVKRAAMRYRVVGARDVGSLDFIAANLEQCST